MGRVDNGMLRKAYVILKIREFGELIRELIVERYTYIYVSGSAKTMPADVLAVVKEIIAEHGGMSK